MTVTQSECKKICSVRVKDLYTYIKYIYVAWCEHRLFNYIYICSLDNLGVIVHLHLGQLLIIANNNFSCNLHTRVFFYCIL